MKTIKDLELLESQIDDTIDNVKDQIKDINSEIRKLTEEQRELNLVNLGFYNQLDDIHVAKILLQPIDPTFLALLNKKEELSKKLLDDNITVAAHKNLVVELDNNKKQIEKACTHKCIIANDTSRDYDSECSTTFYRKCLFCGIEEVSYTYDDSFSKLVHNNNLIINDCNFLDKSDFSKIYLKDIICFLKSKFKRAYQLLES
jgi:hypothetical protein